MPIENGTKVKVVCGDRDTVMFDPFGVVRNLKDDGSFEVQLGYGKGIWFHSGTYDIERGNLILYDWKEGEER